MSVSDVGRNPVRSEAFFLEVPEGRLFALYRRPPADVPVRGNVLYAAPFNEEMNRCRSMVTLQAQALAEQGYGTFFVDYLGTGDSTGEYRDARWNLWLDNLKAALAWLKTQPGPQLHLWGTRLGAVLAAELHAALGDPDVKLMFWQPVLDGKQHFTQFLRLRLAAQMTRADLPKETTGSLRAMLTAGETVEVSGYEIHPELASGMESARLAALAPPAGTRVLWLEHIASPDGALSPASRGVVDDWVSKGVQVDAQTYEGPQFWQVHERVVNPGIIEKTSAWVAAKGPGA